LLSQELGYDPDVARTFVMAFGILLFDGQKKGFWYTVPDLLDKYIDLQIYVLYLNDRR
jgi:hypothetical protein